MAKRKVGRSSRTGRFVSKGFVDKHPSTTETQTVKQRKRKKNRRLK